MAAYWNDEKGEIILCDSVDISIAVATEKVIDGCLTVILQNTQSFCVAIGLDDSKFYKILNTCVAIGLDDSNIKKCGSQDNICHLLRGNFMSLT
jgi:hypothetical protein